jgi:NDP-4-keto-2,6-dideoxyhexose 3-C-methyltransferase
MSATPIKTCRICGDAKLELVLDLGEQVLTGVFPRDPKANITKGPLQLVKCMGPCGLVQLAHNYDLGEMYGENYGYRSGLNRSMVRHLTTKVEKLLKERALKPGSVVLDIGSNDGTTLSQYPTEGLTLIGIDPTAKKFAQYYPPHVKVAAEFFDADTFFRISGGKKASLITSISMFYDLPAPAKFVADIAAALEDGGRWHLEQSYLPLMLETRSYDTVCHEHLEYYALAQIQYLTSKAGMRITHVELNDVNGGSFAVTAEKSPGPDAPIVKELLDKERAEGLHTLEPYRRFAAQAAAHKVELPRLLRQLKSEGKKVIGLGASTKGNVVLQYCGITPELMAAVAEVNPDKFGCYTPGTLIPIISEEQARKDKPDVFMVLPWHFRKTFVEREQPYLSSGGKLMFPLPKIELVP